MVATGKTLSGQRCREGRLYEGDRVRSGGHRLRPNGRPADVKALWTLASRGKGFGELDTRSGKGIAHCFVVRAVRTTVAKLEPEGIRTRLPDALVDPQPEAQGQPGDEERIPGLSAFE